MTFAQLLQAGLLSGALCVGPAGAATFSYVFSGVIGGGTLNGTSFASTRYRIQGTADTAAIVQKDGMFSVALQDVVVEGSFGTVVLTSPVNVFMDNDFSLLGLGRGTGGGVHLIEVSVPTLSYDLKTALIQQDLPGVFMNWNDPVLGAVTSTGGPLVFDTGAAAETDFTATQDVGVAPVPLPAGGLLLTLAVAALAALRRRGAGPAR